jgi:type IV secretory pathway TraG/TraD family ATPase VirD4
MFLELLRRPEALFAVAALMLLLVWAGGRRSRENQWRRGTRIVERSHRGRGGESDADIYLAGIRIPPGDECKHFKILGTTGTGKSTAILELLRIARRRMDRAVIADPDGVYAARFYDRRRGDVILNPFEPESVQWDLFAEIRDSFDAEQLAAGLIPNGEDPAAREWRGYGRTFLAALLRRCRERGIHSSRLWWLLSVAPVEELRSLLEGTSAQPFLEPDNLRMFGSIRSVTASALAALEHVRRQRASPFSVRHFAAQGQRGWLFMPYRANHIAALRSVIAAWLRLAIFEVMSGTPGADQHIWFVVDELDALGAVDGLKDALARLRKFGGRCVLGFQSLAQVSSTYAGDAQTLIENCATTLILRCSAGEGGGTARFASQLIGEREVMRRQISRGSDRSGLLAGGALRRSRNVSQQVTTESAVMPSEIEQLPDFHGYLKTASSPAWFKVRLF